MGIDIYARWTGQSDTEQAAQSTGFSIAHGHIGYLREAYHGGPYATQTLLPEAFNAPNCEAAIPAATLRTRLPETLRIARERQRRVYHCGPRHEDTRLVCKSFTEFVRLCEAKERETGEPCRISASY